MYVSGSKEVNEVGAYRGNPPNVSAKAGRPKNLENMPLQTIPNAKEFLARLIKLTLRGDIDTKLAYCINALVNTFLRIQEADYEERISRLEEMVDTEEAQNEASAGKVNWLS